MAQAFGGLFGGLGGMFGGGGGNAGLAGLLGSDRGGGGGGFGGMFGGGGGGGARGMLGQLAPNPMFGGIPNILNPVAGLLGGLFGGDEERPPNRFAPGGQALGDFAPYFNERGQRGLFNPSPFMRGIDSDTAKSIRSKAKRTFTPAMAALISQDALLPASLFLTGKASAGYGDIWRDEARKSQDFYKQSIEEQSPGSNQLFGALTQDALGLVTGQPNRYDTENDRRAILREQASRGAGYGQSDAMRTLLGLDRQSEARRIGRGNYGADIARLGQGYYSQILGLGPTGSNPQSPVQATSTDDLLSLGLSDTQARRNQHAARVAGNQALWGNAIQAVGNIGGMAAMACWVAEELYGSDDERTHLARRFVATHESPFIEAYRKHGKKWAAWLRKNEWAKPMVQPIWDAMWQEQAVLLGWPRSWKEDACR